MAKRYIKKAPIVEAVQWTGNNLSKIQEFIGCNILIPEGAEYALPIGDYIIKFPNGEIHTCSADFFKLTYEEVGE